ncbi:MAG: hypothetical protein LBM65_03560 [Oscillospiraceae bacterium]|jgi:hypothetical protein|nr:hypothetical protein [Oscillospiraceae bacterium]
MLTVFNVENTSSKWKIMRFFSLNKVIVSYDESCDIAIRNVSYVCRNGKIDWQYAAKALGQGRNCVLAPEQLLLPQGCGITRFLGQEYYSIMCCNFFFAVLNQAAKIGDISRLKIGLYDETGAFATLLKKLLGYTSNLRVLTKTPEVYGRENSKIFEETGASAMVGTTPDFLRPCKIILAPGKISTPFEVENSSVMLTSAKPNASLFCRVFYSYKIELPKKYRKAKPQFLTDEYFASGLFSVGGVYKLGGIVPEFCSGGNCTQTIASLAEGLQGE